MRSKKAILVAVLCLVTTSMVFAKLPAPTDEQKEKAEAAKAKAADDAKKGVEALTKSQDRIVDRYIKTQKANGVTVKRMPIAVAAAPGLAPSAAPAGKPAAPAAAMPAKK